MSQSESKDESKEDEDSQTLPSLVEGEKISVVQENAEEKKTQRPPLLTEAELLKLMETAGKICPPVPPPLMMNLCVFFSIKLLSF